MSWGRVPCRHMVPGERTKCIQNAQSTRETRDGSQACRRAWQHPNEPRFLNSPKSLLPRKRREPSACPHGRPQTEAWRGWSTAGREKDIRLCGATLWAREPTPGWSQRTEPRDTKYHRAEDTAMEGEPGSPHMPVRWPQDTWLDPRAGSVTPQEKGLSLPSWVGLGSAPTWGHCGLLRLGSHRPLPGNPPPQRGRLGSAQQGHGPSSPHDTEGEPSQEVPGPSRGRPVQLKGSN